VSIKPAAFLATGAVIRFRTAPERFMTQVLAHLVP
jgi:hypothetical protein